MSPGQASDPGLLRVAVDASALREGRSGIGVYVEHLLAALPAAGVQPLPFSNRRVPGWPRASRWPLRPTALWTWGLAGAQAAQLGAQLCHYPTGRAPGRRSLARVVTVHDLWPFEAGRLLRRRERWLTLPGLRRGILSADRIIAVSRDTAAALQHRFPQRSGRVVVIPEGPSLDPRMATWSGEHLRRRIGLADGQPFWLHVGTLEARKRLDRVIAGAAAARAALSREGCPAPLLPALVLVGADGGQRAALARQARSQGLGEGLRLPGFVEPALLASLYRDAALYIALSLHEGFGLALLDAMVFGLPVLSSGAGALAELAPPDCALRVEGADPAALATALLAMHRDEVLCRRLGEAGRLRAGDFSWSQVASATAALYHELVGTRRSR